MHVLLTFVLTCSQFVSALSFQPATTQPSRGGRAPLGGGRFVQHEPVVLKLTNANCFEVAKMLQATFPMSTSYPVNQSNSVVFAGPEDELAMARKLVAQTDEMAVQRNDLRVVITDVKHRRVDDLVEHLHRIADGRLQVSGDRGRSKVLLRGDLIEVEKAQNFLQQLDTPSVPVAVEFAFIQATREPDPDAPKVTGDLAEVAKELERFGKLTLWGRLSTVAVEGEKFSVEGQIVPGIKAEVRGMVGSGSPADSVRIELKTALFLNHAQGDKTGPGPQPYFNLETVVTAKRGEFLVLGSAPTGSVLGESAILVMHVRK